MEIAKMVTQEAFRCLSKLNIKNVFVCVGSGNSSSLRVRQKERFRKIGTITYLKLSRLRLHIFKGETRDDLKKIIALYGLAHQPKLQGKTVCYVLSAFQIRRTVRIAFVI